MSAYLFSVDWGTTRFRLRLVQVREREVIAVHVEDTGVRSLHASLGADPTPDQRAAAFSDFLRGQADRLARTMGLVASNIPVLVSGMASSSVGWRELAYARTPFPLDGRTLIVDGVDLWPVSEAATAGCWLVSGVRSDTDMMRGEETEAVGLHASGAEAALSRDALVLLPGTHSKHLQVRAGSVVSIRTFLTGELFEVLARHSLLRASVVWPVPETLESAGARSAFEAGLDLVRTEGLSESLFRVRTRTVLGGAALRDNGWFLSGLLIGAEIAGLAGEGAAGEIPIVLTGASSIQSAYATALERAGWAHRVRRVPAEVVDHATVHAHLQIWRHLADRTAAA